MPVKAVVATVEEVPDAGEDAKSVFHHHDHEHHHHHSHYERVVDEDGTVRETTVTEDVTTEPPKVIAAAAAVAVAGDEGQKKKKKKKKATETLVEERNTTANETVVIAGPSTSNSLGIEPAPAIPAPATVVTRPASIAGHPAALIPIPATPGLPTNPLPASTSGNQAHSTSRHGSPVLATRTVTTTTNVIAPASHSRAPSVYAPSIRAPSAKAASVRASTIGEKIVPPATTVVPPVIVEQLPLPVTVPTPPSPTPSHRSHRSHRSHHHPEIVVNVNVPTAAAPAQPANPILPAATNEPVIAHNPVLTDPIAIVAPSPIRPPPPLPITVPSAPASPALSVRSARSMRLPKILRNERKETQPIYVQALPEEPAVIETQPGDEIVTKVVTTTTTTRRAPTPPKTPSPEPKMAHLAYPPPPLGISYVVPDTTYVPQPVPAAPSFKAAHAPLPAPMAPPTPITPAPPALREGSPSRFIETTTVETVTYPISVDTAAKTIGSTATKGHAGTTSAVLTNSTGRPDGTKAGLRPIPMVNYASLIRATPPAKKLALTAPPQMRYVPPQGPQTVLAMSADLERDSKRNEHLHATVRDHTNVKKTPFVPATNVLPESSPVISVRGHRSLTPEDAASKTAQAREIREKGRKKKDREFEKEIEDEIQSVVEDIMDIVEHRHKKDKEGKNRDPIYRTLGGTGLPPPKSERYAYPPAPTVIEQTARDRFAKRLGMGQAGPPGLGRMMPGMAGLAGLTGTSGPRSIPSRYPGGYRPMPPPGPITMPAPPTLMGGRPGMFGPPMMNPMMTQPGSMGGAGLMGAPMPQMGIPYAPMPAMGFRNMYGR